MLMSRLIDVHVLDISSEGYKHLERNTEIYEDPCVVGMEGMNIHLEIQTKTHGLTGQSNPGPLHH